MEEDRVLRRNLAYVGAVTKISKAATKAFQNMYNPKIEESVNKNKPLFTEKTLEKYMGKGNVERYTGEER